MSGENEIIAEKIYEACLAALSKDGKGQLVITLRPEWNQSKRFYSTIAEWHQSELSALRKELEEVKGENIELREALKQIEAHHVEQNKLKGRELSRSKTLTIIHAVLDPLT
jgi:predicted nuclease with TOPRIM domain